MRVLALCLALLTGPVSAHEFWIEPEDVTLASDQDLVATLHYGSRLEGPTFPYLPMRFTRFDVLSREGTFPLPGRIGDSPAVYVSGLPEGLLRLAYVSTPTDLTYDDTETYARFLREEGLEWAAARNAERGLTPTTLREKFLRYAKTLVAVGDGAGTDAPAGLRHEIVAEANPYTDDLSNGLPLRVLWEGAPSPGVRLNLFERSATGEVSLTPYTTDAEGRVIAALTPGSFALLSTVRYEEQAHESGADWLSHWASLTLVWPG